MNELLGGVDSMTPNRRQCVRRLTIATVTPEQRMKSKMKIPNPILIFAITRVLWRIAMPIASMMLTAAISANTTATPT
jgi:hypothetical protein